jgi:hypothetical protein
MNASILRYLSIVDANVRKIFFSVLEANEKKIFRLYEKLLDQPGWKLACYSRKLQRLSCPVKHCWREL